ncbi:DUF2721 domain-containing protein [Fibrisoma limi]|nr:DUF2721 domain-containing protein [Fibrisoma limi]
MELTVSTPALLFSTIFLSMIAFTNRFLTLSSLTRGLHEKFCVNPDTVYVAQIQNLHRRLILIRNVRILSDMENNWATAVLDYFRYVPDIPATRTI